MGHIINPITFRLGFSKFWNSSWASYYKLNYSYLLFQDFFIFLFITKLFRKKFLYYNDFWLKNVKVNRNLKKITIFLFIQTNYNKFPIKKKPKIFKNFNIRFLSDNFFFLDVRNSFLLNGKKLDLAFLRKKHKLFLKRQRVLLMRKLFWNFIRYEIIRRSFFITKIKDIGVSIFLYYKPFFFAVNIAQFITRKLKQRISLFQIINPVVNRLANNSEIIKGFKICCSGRFTRKQRATYFWVTRRNVAFNSIKSNIDYAFLVLKLKPGLCGIKVWINSNKFNTVKYQNI